MRRRSKISINKNEIAELSYKTREEVSPEFVLKQYLKGVSFKKSIGARGLFEQNRLNERFFLGDQWTGANCGDEKPLVRYNVIKRIADYKMAVVGGEDISIKFSAEGVPDTIDLRESLKPLTKDAFKGEKELLDDKVPYEKEVAMITEAMSDYYSVTAKRIGFEDIRNDALRNSYISGTGIVYTYWDNSVETGLYADKDAEIPIRGDIACEVLDVENVYFGNYSEDKIERQPYIIIAQRNAVSQIKAEARVFGVASYIIEKIKADSNVGPGNDVDGGSTTVLTKFWKEWDKESGQYFVWAVKVCNGVTVRPPWNLGVRLYPFAKFSWEKRKDSPYGESEISYIIPNQIAINRMITASVWAVMMMGMPITLVNGDVITQNITNDPGQIIEVFGDVDEVLSAIKYVSPPNFSADFDKNIMSLINNTLNLAGANEALLGDINPNNTSAILAVREATLLPIEYIRKRYYNFCEDIGRIWAEFWVTQYGNRYLKINDESGIWYLPFDGDRYKNLVLTTKVDVVSSLSYGEKEMAQILNSLYDRQIIDKDEYLSRVPKGFIPRVEELIKKGGKEKEG